MELKDVNIDKVNQKVFSKYKGVEYKGFVIGTKEPEQEYIPFENKDIEVSVFITPITDEGTMVTVLDTSSGKVIKQYRRNIEEINQAIEKSESEDGLLKRITKIIDGSHEEIIDDAIEEIKGYREELKEKEKKWYVATISGQDQAVEIPGQKDEEGRKLTKEDAIAGPFETFEEADAHSENLRTPKPEKFNNPENKYYIISNGRILYGWEFKEDARDGLSRLPPVKRGESRIVSKRDLTIDPENNENWGDANINESEILDRARKNFEFHAEKKFSRFVNHEAIQRAIKEASPKQILETYIKSIMGSMQEARNSGLDSLSNELGKELNHALELALMMDKNSIPKEKGGSE